MLSPTAWANANPGSCSRVTGVQHRSSAFSRLTLLNDGIANHAALAGLRIWPWCGGTECVLFNSANAVDVVHPRHPCKVTRIIVAISSQHGRPHERCNRQPPRPWSPPASGWPFADRCDFGAIAIGLWPCRQQRCGAAAARAGTACGRSAHHAAEQCAVLRDPARTHSASRLAGGFVAGRHRTWLATTCTHAGVRLFRQPGQWRRLCRLAGADLAAGAAAALLPGPGDRRHAHRPVRRTRAGARVRRATATACLAGDTQCVRAGSADRPAKPAAGRCHRRRARVAGTRAAMGASAQRGRCRR